MLLYLCAVLVDIGDKKIETLTLPFLFRPMLDQDAIFVVDVCPQFPGRHKLMNPRSGTS
jgi:hypothetical protein